MTIFFEVNIFKCDCFIAKTLCYMEINDLILYFHQSNSILLVVQNLWTLYLTLIRLKENTATTGNQDFCPHMKLSHISLASCLCNKKSPRLQLQLN